MIATHLPAPAIGKRVKLSPSGGADVFARPEVDPARMSVTGVLCTPTRDRDGDIIEPSGADVARHRSNPVVFLNHGIVGGIPGMALPVGKAVDPAGRYTVRYDRAAAALIATTYFANTRDGAAVFRLYDDDILRGFSIGYMPLRVKKMLDQLPGRQRRGVHVDRWELLEYSCVGVPSNPDALRVRLQKGLGGGVSVMLKAVLEPMASTPSAWSPGWTPKLHRDDPRAAGTQNKRPDQPEEPELPPGAELIIDVLAFLDGHIHLCEHPQVLRALRSAVRGLTKVFREAYPDLECPTVCRITDAEGELDDVDDEPAAAPGAKACSLPPGKVAIDLAALQRLSVSIGGLQQVLLQRRQR